MKRPTAVDVVFWLAMALLLAGTVIGLQWAIVSDLNRQVRTCEACGCIGVRVCPSDGGVE